MSETPAQLNATLDSSQPKHLSRRQLVKAGVWAAPVVVLATASPAAAVSISTAPVLSAVNVPNAGGKPSAVWNLSLVVSGTTSPKAWSVLPILSNGLTVTWNTAFPTSISAANTYTAQLTVGGANLSTGTVLVRLTSGAAIFNSNAVPVTKH